MSRQSPRRIAAAMATGAVVAASLVAAGAPASAAPAAPAAAQTLGTPQAQTRSSATAGAAASTKTRKGKHPRTVDVQILSFNDYHGWLEDPTGGDATLGAQLDPSGTVVGGGRYLASTLSTLRVGHDSSLTVAAGDLIGGSPFLSGAFHDEPSVESLDAMGLDVSSVGNHEFDEGVTELLRMQHGGCHPVDGCYFPDQPYDGADFSWLAANVVYKKGTPHAGRSILPPTWVRRIDGVKVGFIGMTLEDTPYLVAQDGVADVDFKDEVLTANKQARALKARGVKAIVVLLHEGGVQAGTYDGCDGISDPIATIASNLHPQIDLVVTGHTHMPYVCTLPDPLGRPRMVTSASSYGRVVTETILPVSTRTGQVLRARVTSANHLVSHDQPVDATQQAILDKWRVLEEPIGSRVVGATDGPALRSPNRDTESSLANLVADAQLAATSAPDLGGAQIALMNPGGVRADLTCAPAGTCTYPDNVTFGEAFTVQPFSNTLITKTYTGAQLKDILEQQYVPDRPGQASRPVLILGVSQGLTFDFSLSAAQGSRVSNIALNGVPIDPSATYRIAHNSFLTTGGDAFAGFTVGTDPVGGGVDLDALLDYLGANNPLTPPGTDRINEVP